MDDDFNTPEALAVLFDAVRVGNTRLDQGDDAAPTRAAFAEMLEILGLDLTVPGDLSDLADGLTSLASDHDLDGGGSPEETVDALLMARASARTDRRWAVADAIRDGLADLGITIEDSADGARWHRQ